MNNISWVLKTLLEDGIFDTLVEAENSTSAVEVGLVRAMPPNLVVRPADHALHH